MSPARTALSERVGAIERDLLTMADLAVQRLRDALDAWEHDDRALAARVVADDELMDDLCLRIEEQVFSTQLLQAPVARDQRLLHVARIVCVALERVGDLASAVADLTASRTPACAAAPEVESRLAALRELALGSLAQARDALARGDAALAAGVALRAVDARRALRDLCDEVAACDAERPDHPWAADVVLLGRHLERVTQNASEIAGRLGFLITGRVATRHRAPAPPPPAA